MFQNNLNVNLYNMYIKENGDKLFYPISDIQVVKELNNVVPDESVKNVGDETE